VPLDDSPDPLDYPRSPYDAAVLWPDEDGVSRPITVPFRRAAPIDPATRPTFSGYRAPVVTVAGRGEDPAELPTWFRPSTPKPRK
jgi:hypothetical protein